MRVRRRSDHLVPRGRDSPSGTSSARRSTAYAATTKSRSRPLLPEASTTRALPCPPLNPTAQPRAYSNPTHLLNLDTQVSLRIVQTL